jgi:sirohydrochlorin cobaltochelatase
MKTVIVLAMHGVPPRDFPATELTEFFGLHARIESHGMVPALVQRYRDLEARLRAWPRTPANDPFHAASMGLAARLARDTGLEVIVGFNEFCGPSLDEAFTSVAGGAGRVIVVTPMLTQGGEHAERDIPAAIARARAAHPGPEFVYAWPFEDEATLRLLADQVRRFNR